MASPLFDALHVKLARKLFDPVATASTDGAKVSSLLRTDYLNRANRFIQTTLLLVDKSGKLIGQYLPGLVKTQTITWSSSGFTLPTDYTHWISCEHIPADHVKLLFRDPSRKIELDSGFNINDQNIFTIFGGKTYGYYNGSVLSGGTGTLYYLSSDQRSSAGDSADISIDSMWYDCLVDLAASFHFSDRGELSLEAGNIQRTKLVLQMIGLK